jgi:iron(III) transport system substrate-binding protein
VRDRKRRFSAIIPVVVLLVAACSPGGTSTGSSGPSTGVEASPVAAGTVDEVLSQLADKPYAERVTALEACARQEDGSVLVYGASNVEMQESWAAGFRERYDFIDYEYIRLSSSDLAPRVQTEARAGQYLADVVQVGTEFAIELNKDGLLANHRGVPIPDGMPAAFVEEWFAMNQINPNLIAWNTDLVSEADAPTELDDLLDDRFADGGVVIESAPVAWVSSLILQKGEDGAREFLNTLLNEQGGQVRVGFTSLANLLAAGEFRVSILYADDVEGLITEGAPLDWLAPDPTIGHGVGVALSSHTTNPCTSALVMNYLLDPEGGAQVMADTGRLPTHPGATVPYPRLAEFLEPATALNARLVPLTPKLVSETELTANDLIEEIIVPHIVE